MTIVFIKLKKKKHFYTSLQTFNTAGVILNASLKQTQVFTYFFKSNSLTKGVCPLFSAVCDIGSASFKYDMRRLSEILAFPRAWYRRSIARRLFLGDQTINPPGN